MKYKNSLQHSGTHDAFLTPFGISTYRSESRASGVTSLSVLLTLGVIIGLMLETQFVQFFTRGNCLGRLNGSYAPDGGGGVSLTSKEMSPCGKHKLISYIAESYQIVQVSCF